MALTWINGPTYKSILITQKSLNNKGVDTECIKRGYKLADSGILYQQWTNMIKYQKMCKRELQTGTLSIFRPDIYVGILSWIFPKGGF